ncbi:glycosyltransferase [Streptomyces sp. KR80]|uniref:glycosyltransferase n=1 Tax=Streptomyces sp. KR80 TaxID=3457426 RepID=UPI003FD3ED10
MTTTAPPPATQPEPEPEPLVGVIVIGFNDSEHIGDAVLSALRQGPAVAEVVVVDDASTDATPEVLKGLAARDARVRVVRRTKNSGGCGTPATTACGTPPPPVCHVLDSDDVLGPGAVDALLAAAVRHDAPVVAGACVRRELPDRRDVPWQPALFLEESVHDSPADRPRLVRDTLCVNKMYSRAFLTEHGITFPEGAFRYSSCWTWTRWPAVAARTRTSGTYGPGCSVRTAPRSAPQCGRWSRAAAYGPPVLAPRRTAGPAVPHGGDARWPSGSPAGRGPRWCWQAVSCAM